MAQLASAIADFHEARRQAAWQEVLARFTGRATQLLAYDDVYRKLKPTGSAEVGLREIPLVAIVGSVNRYNDFTRDFLPRNDSDAARWATVKMVAADPTHAELPPIEVYQVGEVYFVIDGNHRVSVARQHGAEYIPAYVTVVKTRVPLTPEVDAEQLILKAEYTEFLEFTQLDQTRPPANLQTTAPGQFRVLVAEVERYRDQLMTERQQAVAAAEAAVAWYDTVYWPVAEALQAQGLLQHFPNRTVADLYIWVQKHREELHTALGWPVSSKATVTALAQQTKRESVVQRVWQALTPAAPTEGQWRKDKLAARYVDRLFADLLVPLSDAGAPWLGLTQAIAIAQREQANLYGLHVVPTERLKNTAVTQQIVARFAAACAAAGVRGDMAIEVGDLAHKVCERATLADGVVLALNAPAQETRLTPAFRNILRYSPRPLWLVPPRGELCEHALLAFDGSPKSKEALFVATYLADQWKVPLTVLVVREPQATLEAAEQYARTYLDIHEVAARFVVAEGEATEKILETAATECCDCVLLGSYGGAPRQDNLGRTLEVLLKRATVPLLICR